MIPRHFSQWADEGLADAYDLIEAVVQEHSLPTDKLPEIAGLLPELDRADRCLAETLAERKAA
ncbi:hypothetical protein JMG10_13285 [Nostoc ellipsosporum NOK]|nr:hypothetical protein [Nostoc ellipsosporum NOK]